MICGGENIPIHCILLTRVLCSIIYLIQLLQALCAVTVLIKVLNVPPLFSSPTFSILCHFEVEQNVHLRSVFVNKKACIHSLFGDIRKVRLVPLYCVVFRLFKKRLSFSVGTHKKTCFSVSPDTSDHLLLQQGLKISSCSNDWDSTI